MRALVLGGAACVWADVDAALGLGEFDMVVACNDIGALWPGRLDHWASLHPERLPKWESERRARGYPGGWVTWAHRAHKGIARDTGGDWAGSSGLLAVRVALEVGASRVVLAGVPLDRDAGHVVRQAAWPSADAFRKGWKRHEADLIGVRSMSGWTREFLGAPDEVWLACY